MPNGGPESLPCDLSPIPRRRTRRRCDVHRKPQTRTLYRVWRAPLEIGQDVFGELGDIGVKAHRDGRPDHDAARAAWHRFGCRILAERHPGLLPAWAETEFGRPFGRQSE